MARRDDRPMIALGAFLALVAVAFLVPASRAWLLESVIEPLRAQADPQPGLSGGYTFGSLVVWALVGAVFAWVAYEIVFTRSGFAPDASFFAALAPALLLGPLLHAALIAHALPRASVLAYLAAEPLVYVTIALFAGVGLAIGRLTRRPLMAPLLWGGAGVALVLFVLVPEFTASGLRQASLLLVLAIVPAFVLAFAYVRMRPGDPLPAVFAVIAAHALDGATTWMVLRDPFDMGFRDFGERNPVSLTLVNLSNGWPFFVVKLALPLLLLFMVAREAAAAPVGDGQDAALRAKSDARLRSFLLFAVFVLGFGPGMANLLQVMMG